MQCQACGAESLQNDSYCRTCRTAIDSSDATLGGSLDPSSRVSQRIQAEIWQVLLRKFAAEDRNRVREQAIEPTVRTHRRRPMLAVRRDKPQPVCTEWHYSLSGMSHSQWTELRQLLSGPELTDEIPTPHFDYESEFLLQA